MPITQDICVKQWFLSIISDNQPMRGLHWTMNYPLLWFFNILKTGIISTSSLNSHHIKARKFETYLTSCNGIESRVLPEGYYTKDYSYIQTRVWYVFWFVCCLCLIQECFVHFGNFTFAGILARAWRLTICIEKLGSHSKDQPNLVRVWENVLCQSNPIDKCFVTSMCTFHFISWYNVHDFFISNISYLIL